MGRLVALIESIFVAKWCERDTIILEKYESRE